MRVVCIVTGSLANVLVYERVNYALSIPQQSLDIHQPSAPLFAAAAAAVAVVIIIAVVVVVRDSISAIIMMAGNDNGRTGCWVGASTFRFELLLLLLLLQI